jgi:predicted acyl esterase
MVDLDPCRPGGLAVLLLGILGCDALSKETSSPPTFTDTKVRAVTETPVADTELTRLIQERFTKFEYRIPMRDGVKLYTVAYVPKEPGKYPVMLTRTPYGVQPYGVDTFPSAHRALQRFAPSAHFIKEGYILVHQDVRGRMMS